MIDKLIEKYKEQKFSSDFAKSSLEALMVNQKLDEILQDLEDIKKAVREELYNQGISIAEYKGACKRLGVDKDE